MTISEQIARIWEMEKTMKRTEPVPRFAEPWGVYPKMSRRCTECNSKDLVRDGMYYCKSCHPTYGKEE